MPYNEVFPKMQEGNLHSGSKDGPKVRSKSQAVAIYLAEKRKAEGGDSEYAPIKGLKAAKGNE